MTKKKVKGWKGGKGASFSEEPETIPEQTSGDSESTAGDVHYGAVTGLDNLGNTCFFNSALQMLQAAPQLRAYFGASAEELGVADGPLGEGIREVFMESMKDGSNSSSGNYKFRSHSVNPQPLLSAVCEIAPQFKGRDQHDSHELLRFLLDGLQSEEEKLSIAKTEIMKRATDVEEGLIFRRMSSCSDHDEVLMLLEDVADLDVFQEKFRNSMNQSRESSEALPGGDDSYLPPSDPIFAEDDNDDSHLPPSDPVFADDDSDDGMGGLVWKKAGRKKREEEEEEDAATQDPGAAGRASMAALARSASLKVLKRSLTAPAATTGEPLLGDASTPASLIAEQTAAQLLKRTVSASISSRQSPVGSRRLTFDGLSSMPPINEDAEMKAEEGGEEGDEEQEGEEAKLPSFIQAVFGGTLASTVKCDGCGFESVTQEPFLDISIPVPSGLKAVKDSNVHNKVDRFGGKASKPNLSVKEMKRLSKEAKKKDKMDRRKAHSAKQELQFEMVLTPEQEAEAGGEPAHESMAANPPAETETAAAANGEEEEEEAGAGLSEAIDALAGCTMEASEDDTEAGGDPGKLPEWNPDEGEFSIFSDNESSLKVNTGTPTGPKFAAEGADEGEEADDSEEVTLLTCLQAFFKPEHIEWQCPKESSKEEDSQPKSPSPAAAPKLASQGRRPSRRVSFAGSDGEPEPEAPPRRGVTFSKESPTIYKIPGSEEQRGTDFAAAMKGHATFNKPFKYSGNDFIARVRLDTWAYDRLDVLIGPNWDEDAEDMWPEEQKIADVQIDEITAEEHGTEEMQLLLQHQAQVLLDCFSDLFMCQGPTGLLNILRAGFVTLEERGGANGEKERWVVVGRFPPGQIGGAKEWVYPPNSDASRELFATALPTESPSPSPQRKSPLKSSNFTKTLRSSLKKPASAEEVTTGLTGLKISTDNVTFEKLPSITSPLPASPSITHFPPQAAFPSIEERATDSEDEHENVERVESGKPAGKTGSEPPPSFDWSTFDGSNAPGDSDMKSFGEASKPPGASEEGKEEKEDAEMEEDEAQEGPKSALTSALAKGARIEGKQIRRQRPNTDGEEGISKPSEDKPAETIPASSPPAATPRKSGMKKNVQRPAVKTYQIYRAPEVLTVHLKRFHQDMRGRLQKISGALPFDFDLDLAPFCDPAGPAMKDGARYELVGLVEHSGTLRGGHYIAYVRRTAEVAHAPDDDRYPANWYYASDTLVRKVDRSEVENAEAYMLLYVRRP
mmetsp:Transcript_33947/g.96181  ORF Transcript_33947/g.96181 Transcript_33947/m.96181 type:complete len:1242 (+) Transcript_33947:377-4102(+)|eukprot:CAMPEP_0117663266 /NCGR_PEP_ID=MMETSP0804-20121206/8511_1 /TAXON_ID=1074897 /ORGANISM="Tetraselmis astigmatica, Strain CCMP880" /LENGTH=1241 /DNA_ID=CAMNT_0005470253 /DNA_START=290 /DNA_END=4015 /DNA_ORIENTATION=+